jgi:hypothetical protein
MESMISFGRCSRDGIVLIVVAFGLEIEVC